MALLPSKNVQWSKFLRPLYWWLLLVLCLYGYRQHQKWLAQTRLEYSIKLNGKAVGYESETRLDGRTTFSSQWISLGRHTFTITHPKGESITTNFFCWYGGKDFGEINLKRKMGSLSVTANPPAPTLTLTGPEFSLTLHQSSGTNLTVPTDDYLIQATYSHWRQSGKATVSSLVAGECTITPRFGDLHLTGNQDGETFELQDPNGQSVESGTLPATVTQLPTDTFLVKATYHNRRIEQSTSVTSGITNVVVLDFLLGAARLESFPSGAEVHRKDGAVLGKTPLVVPDLSPQMAEFDVTLLGYQTASVTLAIAADRTNVCRTNLINIRYQSAMKAARTYQAATNFDGVVQATGEAMTAQPDDVEALDMQMAAKAQLSYLRQRAEAAARLAETERERIKQLTRPREVFTALCAANPDSQYFDEHETKSIRPAKELAEAIVKSLAATPDGFQILENSSPSPKTYVIRASRGHSYSILGGMANTALIVVGQTRDGETQLLFKVLPYQIDHGDVLSALVNNKSNVQLVLMTPDRIKGNDIWTGLVETSVGKVVQRILTSLK